MLIQDQNDVTEAVLKAIAQAPDARHAEILSAAVRHLHAFVREAGVSEEELEFAFDFLNRIGQAGEQRAPQ